MEGDSSESLSLAKLISLCKVKLRPPNKKAETKDGDEEEGIGTYPVYGGRKRGDEEERGGETTTLLLVDGEDEAKKRVGSFGVAKDSLGLLESVTANSVNRIVPLPKKEETEDENNNVKTDKGGCCDRLNCCCYLLDGCVDCCPTIWKEHHVLVRLVPVCLPVSWILLRSLCWYSLSGVSATVLSSLLPATALIVVTTAIASQCWCVAFPVATGIAGVLIVADDVLDDAFNELSSSLQGSIAVILIESLRMPEIIASRSTSLLVSPIAVALDQARNLLPKVNDVVISMLPDGASEDDESSLETLLVPILRPLVAGFILTGFLLVQTLAILALQLTVVPPNLGPDVVIAFGTLVCWSMSVLVIRYGTLDAVANASLGILEGLVNFTLQYLVSKLLPVEKMDVIIKSVLDTASRFQTNTVSSPKKSICTVITPWISDPDDKRRNRSVN